MMDRRRFVGLLGGSLAGLVIAPRFGRWFRPNRLYVPGPPIYIGGGEDWPTGSMPGDLGMLLVESPNEVLPLPPPGWSPPDMSSPGPRSRLTAFHRIATSWAEPMPEVGYPAMVAVFRGVDHAKPLSRLVDVVSGHAVVFTGKVA